MSCLAALFIAALCGSLLADKIVVRKSSDVLLQEAYQADLAVALQAEKADVLSRELAEGNAIVRTTKKKRNANLKALNVGHQNIKLKYPDKKRTVAVHPAAAVASVNLNNMAHATKLATERKSGTKQPVAFSQPAVVPARSQTGLSFHADVQSWCRDLLARPVDEAQPVCWCPGAYANSTNPKYNGHPITKYARDADRKAVFNSQHGQDWWLYRNLFQDSFGPNFTYVDLATNDPLFRSSTYFFDACMGWRGACVEANPQHYFNIFQERSCLLVPGCATAKRSRLKFQRNHREMTGGSSRVASENDDGATIDCDSITSMLQRAGLHHVHFLSLDVEGHEGEVIKGLDFTKVSIDVMFIEQDCGSGRFCKKLEDAGYTKVGRLTDYIWAHRDFLAKRNIPYLNEDEQCTHETRGRCREWSTMPDDYLSF